MILRTSATLSSLALFAASACLQVPIVSGLTAAGGVSSGGTGATSSTGGGSTAGNGGSTGGACIVGETSQQLDSCGDAGRCGCETAGNGPPLQCATDSLATPIDAKGRICEAGCQSDADCNILTACVGGVCSLIACGADAGNGTYAFACAMGDRSGRGSCFVGATVDGGRFSLCTAGGTSEGACDTAAASRSVPTSLCAPGFLCFDFKPGTTQGACLQLCDDVTTTCPAGQKCNLELKAPNWGYCL